MQLVIDEKRKTIERLQEKHKEEINDILKSQTNETRCYIDQISRSLYIKYKIEDEKVSLCSRVMKWFM